MKHSHSNSVYVFKPILLLKLWDNTFDTMDIFTFSDLNKFFLIKLYIFHENYTHAFREVEFLLVDQDEVSIQEKSQHAFIYYLGKVVVRIIDQINENQKLSKEIKAFFDYKNIDFYNRVEKVLVFLRITIGSKAIYSF